jgi:hypothetical protein
VIDSNGCPSWPSLNGLSPYVKSPGTTSTVNLRPLRLQ